MDKLKIWGRRLLDVWGIYQLLTVVGFTAITSTLTLAFVRELRSLPLGWQTTFVAGVALFGLVGVWIFWPLVTRLRAKLAGQSELEQSAIATPAVPSVNYPPPEEELPGGENIHAGEFLDRLGGGDPPVAQPGDATHCVVVAVGGDPDWDGRALDRLR